MDRSTAGQILAGQANLDEQLKRLEIKNYKAQKRKAFKDNMANLMTEYPDMMERTARKIIIGRFTVDDYIASLEKKKQKDSQP
ncbi:MAG: hypothetical protein IEMM0008_0614 [bacterium]|nr:MAG: hypothetical protein IEMM0008_0614 [bacterium]